MESAGSETDHHRIPPPLSRDDHEGGKLTTPRPERNSLVPPYWQGHQRSVSTQSFTSIENGSRPRPILLEDHTDEGTEQCKALWAKHVTIDDYVIVSGTAPGLGAYVVWNCTVETLNVSFSPEFRRADAVADADAAVVWCCNMPLHPDLVYNGPKHGRLTSRRVVP